MRRFGRAFLSLALAFASSCSGSRPDGRTVPEHASEAAQPTHVAMPEATVNDYLATQMAARKREFARHMAPASPIRRGVLAQGHEDRFEQTFETGRCYRVIGVAAPELTDLDMFIIDENGNDISRDTAADNYPVIGLGSSPICPRWTGTFYVRIVAAAGAGEYGVQVFDSE